MSTVWDSSPHNLVVGGVKTAWDGFKDFALRDNVLEVAVALVVSSSFTAVVNSLVSDILLPIVSILPFLDRNIESKFAVLRPGPHYNATINGYNTIEQAADDGAVTLSYGLFITHVIHFFAVAFALYTIAQVYSKVSHDSIITKTTRCGYCRKYISMKAKRCAFCTSWQDGREGAAIPPSL